MTRSQFDESCAIFGTDQNIEIHHLRSVKNVRVKTRTHAQWQGRFLRKTVSLCRGHHIALYNRTLSESEVNILTKYRGKSSSNKENT